MLNKDKAQRIFETVRKFATADEVEVLIAGGKYALTRFANNTIHQNVAEENYICSIRTVFGGRTARSTTNKFDEESLRRAVADAEAISRVQQPDADLAPLAGPELAPKESDSPSRHFESAAKLTPEDRARGVHGIVEIAKQNDLTAAGIFSSSDSAEAILNSKGLVAFHQQTSAEVSITMLGADSSGWQKFNSPDAAQVKPLELAQTAARKAKQSAAPRSVEPGKYTVILEPAAVLDLIGFMFYDFAGQSVLDERSFLNNRIGKTLFGENITIHDDVRHALQSGAPFDGEGVRREPVELVKNGVVKNLVYARATAEKMKKSPLASQVGEVRVTGHGFALPNEMGEAPMNIVLAGPAAGHAKTVDEMVASTERGVLVTRLWYIREVEPYEKMLTGMTRDGTFLVENGKLAGGLRNFRFNQSLIEMLLNVEAMGEPVRASGEEAFDMVVPAMKVKEFNFTEVTKF
ncbi:MAG: TldD/PmbA family protein [Candidatus Koribacter versatilis]|uniref:TldD/PmbA family protein n=1 Tax=Candidatus Korobacter versatilis TaxID=658062 RepID=A0A932A7X7_9BACT|nr:TldD/PmbA family protein [Candidatus Koribacter versatilis]